MSDPQLSLSEYLGTVQEVIRLTFDEPVWVRAEIRNLNVKGGHYYLELAEKMLTPTRSLQAVKRPSGNFQQVKLFSSLNVKQVLS